MDTPVSEQGSSLETLMKRGALVCVVAAGGVAVGLAVWALRRWQDEREYQAWRESVSADPVSARPQRLPGRRPARLLAAVTPPRVLVVPSGAHAR